MELEAAIEINHAQRPHTPPPPPPLPQLGEAGVQTDDLSRSFVDIEVGREGVRGLVGGVEGGRAGGGVKEHWHVVQLQQQLGLEQQRGRVMMQDFAVAQRAALETGVWKRRALEVESLKSQLPIKLAMQIEDGADV